MASSTLQNLKREYQDILWWLNEYLDLIEANRPVYENCKTSFSYFPSYSYLELINDSLQDWLAKIFARLVEAKFIGLNSSSQIKAIWEKFWSQEEKDIKNLAQIAKIDTELLFQRVMGK